MGEYEPHDSRNVTLKDERAPGEPPRTGPRERQARQGRSELEGDERGETAEAQREQAMERDADELDEELEQRPDGRRR